MEHREEPDGLPACFSACEALAWRRQVVAADPGLTVVHADAGGIDVGNESHYVAVPPDRDSNPVREFGCWTAALNEMAEWLKSCRIETVAMQATGMAYV
jgi:hypothetical protein